MIESFKLPRFKFKFPSAITLRWLCCFLNPLKAFYIILPNIFHRVRIMDDAWIIIFIKEKREEMFFFRRFYCLSALLLVFIINNFSGLLSWGFLRSFVHLFFILFSTVGDSSCQMLSTRKNLHFIKRELRSRFRLKVKPQKFDEKFHSFFCGADVCAQKISIKLCLFSLLWSRSRNQN